MEIKLSPGDVFRDTLSNFRPSDSLAITFKTEWDWGHTCQINYENISKWPANHIMTFEYCPHLNIANASLNGDMVIEIKRQ
jgi:hypothetical protein